MSPEFQINNKMFGRRVLAHAEKAGEVSADQHGSRKNHKAINTCLNKKLYVMFSAKSVPQEQ